jgi:hypothetical protein
MFCQDSILNWVVHRDDFTAIPGAKPFLPEKYSIEEPLLASFEFRRKCVWHRIVNVQDNFGSEQPWNYGRENQEIWHVVDMNDSISPPEEERSGFE